jgi:hypothetical protein
MTNDIECNEIAADDKGQHTASIRLSGEDTGYYTEYNFPAARRCADGAVLRLFERLMTGTPLGA